MTWYLVKHRDNFTFTYEPHDAKSAKSNNHFNRIRATNILFLE
jgi:hypothetical protein